MGIFSLFSKKKALKQTQSVYVENANTASEPRPQKSIMRGSISHIDPEYQVIGNIISELENLGFHLEAIHTSGETSGHDWTVEYKKSYSSFDEFSRHAKTDYQEACSKTAPGSPELDWDSTRFLLTNRLSVHLSTHNDGAANVYRAVWAVVFPADMSADDELFQKTQDILRRYE